MFGVEAEEQGFDPATGRFDETGVLYARTVFDPLTIIASDGSVQPYLAKAVTPNADYTVWTITARPNVRFHDGTPCDAAAIAGSLNHFKDNLLGVTFTAVSDIVGHERRHRDRHAEAALGARSPPTWPAASAGSRATSPPPP